MVCPHNCASYKPTDGLVMSYGHSDHDLLQKNFNVLKTQLIRDEKKSSEENLANRKLIKVEYAQTV